jgi:hypothetical protein
MSATPNTKKSKPNGREVKRAVTRASARAWKAGQSEDLELPSGHTVLVKRVGPEAFLTSGRVPDALTPIVEEAIRNAEGMRPEKTAKMMDDPKMLPKMLGLMNHVIVAAVVEPEVIMPPVCIRPLVTGDDDSDAEPGTCGQEADADVHVDDEHDGFHKYISDDRDADTMYADEVDFNDKVFIFNFAVGGTRDLERFRSEHGEFVAGVESSASVQPASV